MSKLGAGNPPRFGKVTTENVGNRTLAQTLAPGKNYITIQVSRFRRAE